MNAPEPPSSEIPGTGRLPVVGVLGLGLIGGSIAQCWAGFSAPVVGWSPSLGTRTAAAQHPGITVVDAIEAVVEQADIVVLATPLAALGATLDVVAAALPRRSDRPTITDVGSVKAPIAAHARRVLDDPSIFVPGHPMAGTEHAGWANADPDLFVEARWALVVDEPVDLDRFAMIANLAGVLGARVVPLEADVHDRAVAVTSHLPHLVAAALARQLADAPAVARSLMGPSFLGATRVIHGSGRSLAAELALANPGPLLDAAGGLQRDLEQIVSNLDEVVEMQRRAGEAGSTQAGDTADAAEAAADVRRYFAEAAERLPAEPTLGEFSRPLARDELLAIGRRGGVVVKADRVARQVLTFEPMAADLRALGDRP